MVTGASSGVGRAVALALAREGAAVAVLGRRARELEQTVARIRGEGGKAMAVVADVSSASDVEHAVREARNALGPVDLVVNAAGTLRLGTIAEMAETDWDLLFDTNVKGIFLICREVIPQMQIRGGGAVVNISSVFAFAAGKGAAAYAASKAAVVALTKTMALDHIEAGIRINGVAPGAVATQMLANLAQSARPDDPQSVLEEMARLQPIRRLIEPEEISSMALYLLSDDASAIVGSTIIMDGGRLAQLGAAGGPNT